MAFTSQLFPGEVIINDDPANDYPMPPPGQGRGLDLSPRPREDHAYAGIAEPFPAELLIPESEWQARIQENEERKTRLSDRVEQSGLICKDQNGTNYCWINAPTYCTEVCRILQGHPIVYLSPASCGSVIKGFRNNGGWGKEGLQYIVEHGIVPVAQWPANAIARQYNTEGNWKLAAQYRVTEWWELRPRNLAEQVSLLLRRGPLAVGLNYWSHEVTDEEPVWLDGEVAIRFRNSWGMSWGARGYGVRQGSKRFADDAVAPRVAVAA